MHRIMTVDGCKEVGEVGKERVFLDRRRSSFILRNKFRRNKRNTIKSFYKKFVEELKQSKPSKYFQMLKKLGGTEQRTSGKIEIECLKDMTDQEGAPMGH